MGTIFGIFIASFTAGAINAGIVAVGLTGSWTSFIYGIIIVVSVTIHTMVSKRFAWGAHEDHRCV
jgi:simple sugar transport system permease protein